MMRPTSVATHFMMHNTKLRLALIVSLFTILLEGCLSPPASTDTSPAPGAAPTSPAQDTPEYEYAASFDRYVKGTLSMEERDQLRQSCRGSATQSEENPFCFSLKRAKQLDQIIEEKTRVARPGGAAPLTPFTPDIRGGKVRNWTATRRAKVQALLAGLATATLDTLRLISVVSLRERRCPNNAAIATAALMESYLIDQPLSELIARLYEKGGNCARRRSYDREHFYTRSALFWILLKNSRQANRLLSKVQPRDAFSGRALYWSFHVKQALGDSRSAQSVLRRLRVQHPFSFHTLISYAENGEDPLDALQKSSDASWSPRTRSIRNRKVNSLAVQIEILHKYGFDGSAAMLADWALEDFGAIEPDVRIYLAGFGEPRTQVLTLQDLLLRRAGLRNQQSLQLAYPKAFFDIFEKQKSRVDPFLLLAIARKESILNPLAISPANAQGLLQLNPTTAKKLRPGENINLLDPQTNADLAARYLASLLDMMRGQLPLVIASYNAGEDAVLRWVKRYPTSDQLLFLDLIPFRETRDYVGFVMSNYYWYRRLYGADGLSPLRQIVASQLAKSELPDSSRAIKSIDVDKLLESADFSHDDAIEPAMRVPDTDMGSQAEPPPDGGD